MAKKIESKKRTRKAHAADCLCSPCKRKRAKEEKENNSEGAKAEAKVTFIEEVITRLETDNVALKESNELLQKEVTTLKDLLDSIRENSIKEYIENLPEDKYLITFSVETTEMIRSKWLQIKDKFPRESNEATGNEMINNAIKGFLSLL